MYFVPQTELVGVRVYTSCLFFSTLYAVLGKSLLLELCDNLIGCQVAPLGVVPGQCFLMSYP